MAPDVVPLRQVQGKLWGLTNTHDRNDSAILIGNFATRAMQADIAELKRRNLEGRFPEGL